MTHILTMTAEDILIIFGFAIYAGLVYYLITKYLRRYSGSHHFKKNSLRARLYRKMHEDEVKAADARKDFTRSMPSATTFPGRR